MAEIQQKAPNRLVATATLPLLDVRDAAVEVHRAAENGFHTT